MSKFEVTWSMFGTAKIDADSMDEATELASKELIRWRGFGTDFDDVMVDGAEADS